MAKYSNLEYEFRGMNANEQHVHWSIGLTVCGFSSLAIRNWI